MNKCKANILVTSTEVKKENIARHPRSPPPPWETLANSNFPSTRGNPIPTFIIIFLDFFSYVHHFYMQSLKRWFSFACV